VAKLTVSLAGVDYDRTRALFDGTGQVACCERSPVPSLPRRAFHHAFRYQEFDITEWSLSNTMALLARRASHYVAVPVFPSRLFRHSSGPSAPVRLRAHERMREMHPVPAIVAAINAIKPNFLGKLAPWA
jgi:4,5-dihydroxyphthalate decarboxylase